MAAATSRSTYDTPLTSDERNAVFSGDRYAASDEALNANRALGAAGQETAESPAISKVVISAKRLTWFEKAWSFVQEVGGAIADFASNMASSSPGTYGTSSSAGYFYIPRDVQKARNDRVSGIAPGSPPNLWRQGVNGLASSLTTLTFGGTGVRPNESEAWRLANPTLSRFDGHPSVVFNVDVFNGTYNRTIGTSGSTGDELLDILSFGLRPLGKTIGNFAGGFSVAGNAGYSWDQRSQGAFDVGANSPGVAAGLALTALPMIRVPSRTAGVSAEAEFVGPLKTGFTADEIAYYRARTPNQEMRDMVNPVGPKMDPVYGYGVHRLEADHIVPFDEIMGMPGMPALPRDRVLEVLNMPENFMGLGKPTNASKGAKTVSDWPGHSQLGPVPPNVRASMLQADADARAAIQRAILRGKNGN